MSIMRSKEEIINRINIVSKRDFFGFETGELIFHLPFDSAKEFLRPEVTREEYKQMSCERDDIVARMLDYMPFAWEKANGCRGISASRSMSYFTAWVWLSGDDLGNLLDYQYYGKDELVRICAHYGWDASQWDDGIRTNSG